MVTDDCQLTLRLIIGLPTIQDMEDMATDECQLTLKVTY